MATGLQKTMVCPNSQLLISAQILGWRNSETALLLEAIKKISEIGGDVHGVVFDGAPKNFSHGTKIRL